MTDAIAATKMSTKALKTMGISTEQLIESFLESELGSLTENNWDIFWHGIRAHRREKVSLVINQLIAYFLRVCNAEYKVLYTPQRLLNTITFFSLWNTVNPTTQLHSLIKDWKSANLDHNSQLEGSHILLRTLSDSKEMDESKLHFLITEIVQMRPDNVYHVLHRDRLATMEGTSFPAGASMSIFSLLRIMCLDPNTLHRILDVLVEQLLAIKYTPTSPEQSHDTAIATLHIVRSLTHQWRVLKPGLLDKLVKAVSPLYNWPYPTSRVASVLLQRLRQEQLAPCFTMLERLAGESRTPELLSFPEDEEDALQRSRPVYYIVDTASPDAESFHCLLNLWNAESFLFQPDKTVAADQPSCQVKALFLFHILTTEASMTKEEAESIHQLTSSDIDSLFETLVQHLQECLCQSLGDSVTYRSTAFTTLKQTAMDTAASNASKGTASDLHLKDRIPDDFLPQTAPVAHVALYDPPSIPYPTDAEIESCGFTPYCKPDLHAKIVAMLQLYHTQGDEADPIEVRIVLTGDDAAVNRFVSSYLAIATQQPHLLKHVVLRIFLVPFTSSSLASYLARHDPWYAKTIAAPFSHDAALMPGILPTDSDSKEDDMELDDPKTDKSMMPPVLFLRDTIESYVHDATFSCPIKLFKLECWKEEKELSKRKFGTEFIYIPDAVLPMVKHLEIGDRVQQMEEKKKVSPVEIGIQFTKVDLQGNQVEMDSNILNSGSIMVHRLAVSNYPNAQTQGFLHQSAPYEPSLELMIRAVDRKGKERGRDWCYAEPNQHINKLTLIKSKSESPFMVLVDDRTHGPFTHIQLSPVEIDGAHALLPIRTFFPQ